MTSITDRKQGAVMDWKIEVIVVPVTDVDRAKAFYTEQLGFNLDVDHHPSESFRVVQATPPGSACSITFGINVGGGEPGTVKGIHLCVNDIESAHAQLESNGVKNSGIKHFGATGQMEDGPHPERSDYGSYIFLDDPDGNSWAVQEVKHNVR
jgi:catechol 2,3-dioxygenase-like lactoylglutathione lyase family enzyme